ncbi:MAG: winged helix-turn-helix domain-containing protein [Actinomycetia bacterium]|nr:winged helix-turn-helix domain-containing protein [Actinomycetes bacterium]
MSATSPRRLSAERARRVALAAQGFGSRPEGRIDAGTVRRMIERMAVLQLDSVPVVVRSQYLPLFSRLGVHDRHILDRLAYERDQFLESWAHEASLIPTDRQPYFRWRQADHTERGHWSGLGKGDRAYVEAVYGEVADRGPIRAADLTDQRKRSGDWWANRSGGRRALEWLFATGRVSARRTGNFERTYDLIERVVPAPILDTPTPRRADAVSQVVDWAAQAYGVATIADLADYWRLKNAEVQPAVDELVEAGRLEPVAIEGWDRPAWLHSEARMARKMDAVALLSPFDPVCWNRDRAERLFGFRYRIEIYVPAAKRVYGYYVLPFLQGDRLTARVDLKSDRKGRALLVRSVHVEEGVDAAAVAPDLGPELGRLAAHLDLDDVVIECDRADAKPLREMSAL